jgi:hypothetical protein
MSSTPHTILSKGIPYSIPPGGWKRKSHGEKGKWKIKDVERKEMSVYK